MKRSFYDSLENPSTSNKKTQCNANKNNLSLMALPKSTSSTAENTGNERNQQQPQFLRPVFEKICFFTGTPERVIKWRRAFQNHFCFFEVISTLFSLLESNIIMQKLMLLKDKRGPILKVVYYENQITPMEQINLGQMIRCVGYMTSSNTLTAIAIRKPSITEIATLKRHCYIGDFSISGLVQEENDQ